MGVRQFRQAGLPAATRRPLGQFCFPRKAKRLRLIFDNLTTAVRKVLQGKARLEQESFTRFRAYYNFEARFCNPGAGHEKGGVEGLVGFARRNFLVPVPEAESPRPRRGRCRPPPCTTSCGGSRLRSRRYSAVFSRNVTKLLTPTTSMPQPFEPL